MSQCVQCGRELPSFGFGDVHDTCAECQTAMASAAVRDNTTSNQSSVRPPRRPVIITTILVGICVLVFAAMAVKGVSLTEPKTSDLLRWGANSGPVTLGGQWWRLLTSMFLHVGLLHLAFNMWCLWELGGLAEHVLGKWLFLSLYLLSGFAGGIASLWWHPFVTSAGASGAIFGVAGGLIAVFYLGNWAVSRDALKPTLRSLLLFAGYNLLFGAASGRIDNAAHIGGLLCGLALGALITRTTRTAAGRRMAVAALAILILGGLLWVARVQAYSVHLGKGKEALDAGRLDEAVMQLAWAVRQRPDLAVAHYFLGQAYGRKSDYADAAIEFRKVLQLDPAMDEARYQLGMALAYSGRPTEAEAEFRILQQRNPGSSDVQSGLGLVYARQYRYEEALAAYRRAAELNPDSAREQYNLGLAAMHLGQYDEAIAAFSAGARLAPEDAAMQFGLGDAYRAKRMNAQAEAAFHKAADLEREKNDNSRGGMRRGPP